MNTSKRNEKYRCKYDREWLQNSHEGYRCPICKTIYKEYSTEPTGYIGSYPISDTYLEEVK